MIKILLCIAPLVHNVTTHNWNSHDDKLRLSAQKTCASNTTRSNQIKAIKLLLVYLKNQREPPPHHEKQNSLKAFHQIQLP